jgi:threonine dehydrogenase-like Zn-dependent dehydrogenase
MTCLLPIPTPVSTAGIPSDFKTPFVHLRFIVISLPGGTRLVDAVTTPLLLKTVMTGKLQPNQLITHHFALDDILKAYDTFGNAGREHALKVILKNQ